jgi:hypothetical protein
MECKIRQHDGERIAVETAMTFERRGHNWAVHKRLSGTGWRVSHLSTGLGVPRSEGETPQEAEAKGIREIDGQRQDHLDKIVREAS